MSTHTILDCLVMFEPTGTFLRGLWLLANDVQIAGSQPRSVMKRLGKRWLATIGTLSHCTAGMASFPFFHGGGLTILRGGVCHFLVLHFRTSRCSHANPLRLFPFCLKQVTWGNPRTGGDSSSVQHLLRGVQRIEARVACGRLRACLVCFFQDKSNLFTM